MTRMIKTVKSLAIEIVSLLNEDYTINEIANILGSKHSTIYMAIRRKGLEKGGSSNE